jgi:hypothetical protein
MLEWVSADGQLSGRVKLQLVNKRLRIVVIWFEDSRLKALDLMG